jgi:hypothetical protein
MRNRGLLISAAFAAVLMFTGVSATHAVEKPKDATAATKAANDKLYK